MNTEPPAQAPDPITIAAWAQLPWLVHGFSTRWGGESVNPGGQCAAEVAEAGPSGELNLGFTANDSRQVVVRNRERYLSHLLGLPRLGKFQLVTSRQTHSVTMHRVDATHALDPASSPQLEGDGLMTDASGVLLGILTADCVPVLVVDPQLRAVAAFHAGWRGTVGRIVEKGIARMREEFGSQPGELLAAVGPAIGACCYEIGEEVRELFHARFDYADALFTSHAGEVDGGGNMTACRLDLAEANRRQLLAAGLQKARITLPGECTCCQRHRFFSHRGERGMTGRMMAVIGLRPS